MSGSNSNMPRWFELMLSLFELPGKIIRKVKGKKK